MKIRIDDLSSAPIRELLHGHFAEMHEGSPPGTAYALDLGELEAPEVTVWSAWAEPGEGEGLMGCGALKELDRRHAEIKSMRTAEGYRRRGVGRAVLRHLVAVARERGYERVSLETGSYEMFAAARGLYRSEGFEECGAFGGYVGEHPVSVFMTFVL